MYIYKIVYNIIKRKCLKEVDVMGIRFTTEQDDNTFTERSTGRPVGGK